MDETDDDPSRKKELEDKRKELEMQIDNLKEIIRKIDVQIKKIDEKIDAQKKSLNVEKKEQSFERTIALYMPNENHKRNLEIFGNLNRREVTQIRRFPQIYQEFVQFKVNITVFFYPSTDTPIRIVTEKSEIFLLQETLSDREIDFFKLFFKDSGDDEIIFFLEMEGTDSMKLNWTVNNSIYIRFRK